MFYSKTVSKEVLSTGLIVCATILFVSNDAIIKYLSEYEIRFYHFVFYGTPAYLSVPLYLLISGSFKERMNASNYVIPLFRGLIFVPMPLIAFSALKQITLPEFTTLIMCSPLFSIVFSVFLLKEKLNINIIVSVFVGILGVLLVVQPGFTKFNYHFLLVLFSAFLMAFSSLIVNKYSCVVSEVGFFVYGGIFVHGMSVILFYFDPRVFDLGTTLLIVISSISVNLAIFIFVYVFQNSLHFYGSLSCLNYLQIFWSAWAGIIFFGETLGVYTWIGVVLIVLSGLFSFIAQKKQLVDRGRVNN